MKISQELTNETYQKLGQLIEEMEENGSDVYCEAIEYAYQLKEELEQFVSE